MDRKWLYILNVVSIVVALVIIVITPFHIIKGLLSLITVFPIYYLLILLYINIRDSIHFQKVALTNIEEQPNDPGGESRLETARWALFIGTIVLSALWLALSWLFLRDAVIYAIAFALVIVLLAFYLNISYALEYMMYRRVSIDLKKVILAVIGIIALGVFTLFFLPRGELIWFTIGIPMLALSIYAYMRTNIVVGILKQIKNKPIEPGIDLILKILVCVVFVALIGALFLGQTLETYGITGNYLMVMTVKIIVVLIIAKVIWEIY